VDDLLSWLQKQEAFPKVYWRGRGMLEAFAGAGAKQVLHEVPESPKEPFFGGISFHDRLWKGFPPVYFFSPLLLKSAKEQIASPSLNLKLERRCDTPDLAAWKKSVENSLARIQRKQLDKVVLARKTQLHFASAVDPYAVVRHLLATSIFSTVFLFQIAPHETFIGSTPENLYRRQGLHIESEALAGSRPRGAIPIEDEKMKTELLSSDKEKREFAFVKQFIHAELSPLCQHLKWDETRAIQTAAMHHLYSRVEGQLKDKVSDRRILQTLHPTPSMGGAPRGKALLHLKEEEPFDRGWYAAPIGWTRPGEAEFAIAIRCALVSGREMHLFSGTGIVDGSHPDREWEEMNHKISPYLKAMT